MFRIYYSFTLNEEIFHMTARQIALTYLFAQLIYALKIIHSNPIFSSVNYIHEERSEKNF
jgi:hypothetical protein